MDAERKKKIRDEVISWAKAIVIAFIAALLLNRFVILNANIPSGSMEPTIMTGERVLGWRLSYLFSKPERGDVIIFRYPDDESKEFIKRVIGLPGETVTIQDGKVYINDSDTPLAEEYLQVVPVGSFGPYTVPEDSYFVLGDNRNNSKDSRYWNNTFVLRKNVNAKALFGYFPRIYPLWK